MRIAVIGPLKDQFRNILTRTESVRGTRHSLYWIDKDHPRATRNLLSDWKHYDALVFCTAWVQHSHFQQMKSSNKTSGLKVKFVNTRGTSGVVTAIDSLIRS